MWRIRVVAERNVPPTVNVYVLASGDRVVLIDVGWDAASLHSLSRGLAELGAGLRDVEGVLLTHAHPDHAGLAFTLQQQTGCWIAAHPAEQNAFGDAEPRGPSAEVLARLGAPAAVGDALRRKFGDASRLTLPVLTPLEAGASAPIGGRHIEAVWTPGHSPGHLCFRDESGVLFGGDHVLPDIRPRLRFEADGDARQGTGDTVGAYFDSLRRTGSMETTLLLPGHGEPVADAAALHSEVLAHYQGKVDGVAAVLAAEDGLSAWEIAGRLRRRGADGPSRSMAAHFLAASEVLAFLRHLERLGRARGHRPHVHEHMRWRHVDAGCTGPASLEVEPPGAHVIENPARSTASG